MTYTLLAKDQHLILIKQSFLGVHAGAAEMSIAYQIHNMFSVSSLCAAISSLLYVAVAVTPA